MAETLSIGSTFRARSQVPLFRSIQKNQISAKFKVAILGADKYIGPSLCNTVKRNPLVETLHLYEDDKFRSHHTYTYLDNPCLVGKFYGQSSLQQCLKDMDVILMIGCIARYQNDHFISDALQKKDWAKAIAIENPKAFVLLQSNALDFSLPMVDEILKSRGRDYEAKRILGITTYDVSYTQYMVSLEFQTNRFHVPVIGGQGKMSVPLLSHAEPPMSATEEELKQIAMKMANIRGLPDLLSLPREAVAVESFLNSFLQALNGDTKVEEAFVASSVWDTPFFATKVRFGTTGIEEIYCPNFKGLYQHEKIALDNIKGNLLAHIESGKHFAENSL